MLVLAIIRVPSIIVLGQVIACVYSATTTVPAVIFMVWCLLVGLSDNFLEPLLPGRGLDIPTLVILPGAIGGMVLSGIIGLLATALLMAWLNQGAQPAEQETAGSRPVQ